MPDAKTNPSKPKSWRDVLPIHPAAEWFPPMPADERKALGEDIRQHGQRVPVVIWRDANGRRYLLNGRHRLDSTEALGIAIRVEDVGNLHNPSLRLSKHMPPNGPWCLIEVIELSGGDPEAYVFSTNMKRRHLSAEDKRDVIAKMLKATPEKSDRQIAEQIKSNRNTVGRVRAKLEQTGDVSLSDTRTDTKGRRQPVRKLPPEPTPTTALVPDQPPPAKLIEAVHDVIIAKCVEDVIARITEAVGRVDVIECVTLFERLHSTINGLLVGAKHAVNSMAEKSPKVEESPKTHQLDELPDIPEFLRRQSS